MSANIQGVCQDMLTELSFTKKTLRPGFICRKVSVFFFIFAWPVVIDLSEAGYFCRCPNTTYMYAVHKIACTHCAPWKNSGLSQGRNYTYEYFEQETLVF